MAKYVNIEGVMNEAPLRMEDDKDDMIVDRFFNVGWNTSLGEFMKSINELPTIKIVKCKDCKFSKYNNEDDGYECHSSGDGYIHEADWFCADGREKGAEE